MRKVFTSFVFLSAYVLFVFTMTLLWSQYEEKSFETEKSSSKQKVSTEDQATYFFKRKARASVDEKPLSVVDLAGVARMKRLQKDGRNGFSIEISLKEKSKGPSHDFPHRVQAQWSRGHQDSEKEISLKISSVHPSGHIEQARALLEDLEPFLVPDSSASYQIKTGRDRLGSFTYLEETISEDSSTEGFVTFARKNKKYTSKDREIRVISFHQQGQRKKNSPWLIQLKSSQAVKTPLTSKKSLMVESSFSLKQVSEKFAQEKISSWEHSDQIDKKELSKESKELDLKKNWSYWAKSLSDWEGREKLNERRDLFLSLRDYFREHPRKAKEAGEWLISQAEFGKAFEVVVGALSSAGGYSAESALIEIYDHFPENHGVKESVVMALNTFKGGLSKSGQGFLMKEFEREESIRQTAGLALGSSHRKNPSPEIRRFFKEKWDSAASDGQRSAIVDYVGNTGDESMSGMLVQASSASNPSLRREAAYATRWMDGESSRETLLKLSNDTDSRTRKEAFRAMLYRDWDASFKRPLFRCLQHESKSSVRVQCLQVLIRHQDQSKDIAQALEALFHESDPGSPVHLALRQWMAEEAS